MKKFLPALLFFLVLHPQAFSQKKKEAFIVLSYNVENLFDTVNHPAFDDDAFTPGGEKQWTYDRYKKKIKDLSKVINGMPEKTLPAVIGLAEVENRAVLEDLTGTRFLRKGKYEIIHQDGKDPRGIDCALLYRPALFSYLSHEWIAVKDPSDPDYLLRDILYVKGKAPDGQPLHIFMNHWKSRSGGEKKTERKRMYTAMALRKHLDLLLAKESEPRLIIMGDFNDEPTNRSITGGLAASGKRKNLYLGDQYNMCYDLHNLHDQGTYAYRGQWNMLDQVILSYNLINQKNGLSTTFDGLHILKEEWMLYESEKYGQMLPSSTYGGPSYYGGPSDHLPVFVVFSY